MLSHHDIPASGVSEVSLSVGALPMAGVEAAAARDARPMDARPLVVVVDDSAAVAKALARVLDAKGFRTNLLATALETQGWLEAHAQSDNPHPTAMLIDVHLPDGSGIDLAREARRLFGDSVPVVVLSGDTSIENLRALPEANATMFVAKPVHIPQLIGQIEQWAADHRAGRPMQA